MQLAIRANLDDFRAPPEATVLILASWRAQNPIFGRSRSSEIENLMRRVCRGAMVIWHCGTNAVDIVVRFLIVM